MRYAAIDAEGRATGAIYDTKTAGIVAHHAAYGETLIPVADLVEAEDGWQVIPARPEDLRATMAVSRFQARAALRAAGLLDQVEAMVQASGDPLRIDAWAEAVEIRRLSPMIVDLGAALGLSDEQIDDLFRAASAIEA